MAVFRRIFCSVLCAAGAVAGAATCAAQTHLVQPADIVDLKVTDGPRISPDGREVVYSVRTPVSAGKPRNEHIWLASTEDAANPHVFLYSSGVDTAPAWSPDGRHIAFLSSRSNPLATQGSPFRFTVAPGTNRADIPASLVVTSDAAKPGEVSEKTALNAPERKHRQPAPPTAPEDVAAEAQDLQLWWIALDGGEAEPLTNFPGGIRSFKWSNDGGSLAIIRSDSATSAERERTRSKNDRTVVDQEYHWDRLWIYDLHARQARLLTSQDANIDTVDWAPDDRTIVSRVSATPRLDDYWRVSKVEIFNVANGTVQQTVEADSGYQTPLFSKDGKRLVYSRFTPRSVTDEHFVRTLATGKELRLEDKLEGTLAELRWLPKDHLLVNAYVGAHTETHEVDASTLTATPVYNLPPTALDFDLSQDGKVRSFMGETPTQPAEVSVWRKDKVTVLTSTNPQVSQWALGTEREVHWTNPKDSRTVYGVLSLPPGYVQGKRYKTAIHLHGGPEEAFTVGFNANWYNYAVLLASQGYVVLQPNYRGSAGQDISFTESDFQDLGGGDFDDVMAGADWVVQQGIADPERMVIAGWSYGGFLAAWAATHTDRFQAAMAGAPVTDWFSMATTTDIMTYAKDYLGPLTGHEAEYDRHSPIRYVTGSHTPVLVLQGEADVRVPTSQGMEFYRGLKLAGREVQMVTYPREPHIFGEREHQIDSLTRELEWFTQHLAGSAKETQP